MIHLPTVYLFLGFIYVLMPIAIWIALNNQKSRPMVLWCIGSELFAIGLILIGVRPVVPSWVSYSLANVLFWFAVLIQISALRLVFKKTTPLSWGAMGVVSALLVFEYFRIVLENAHLRFAWSLLLVSSGFIYIAYLARQIALVFQLRNAQVLALIFSVGAFVLCMRIARIVFGYAEPDATAQGLDSFLLVFSGVLVSILGSFAFVGVFIERTVNREMQATAERVRQEESVRLGDQISQLERQRTLGAMSYSFAHELSQPLTAILMDTHAIKTSLQKNHVDMKDIVRSIEDIERSATHTGQLVERIRNFIRPTQSQYELVDMKVLAHDVKQLLLHDIRTHSVTFEWDFDESPCVVLGDKVQLSQIVLNVYRNAIQAMSDATVRRIHVSLESDGSSVILRVHDNGPGFDEVMRHQLGQPFVTTKLEGLGVGLSISKTIADMHSGNLSISNAVDGGAVVELNLPAVTS